MRILVCGDRNWNDYDLIAQKLNGIGAGPHIIIEGEARGADTMGARYAFTLNYTCLAYPADWTKYGRAAGHIRNTQMLVEGKPDLVLAFHDDIENSKGTKNMVNQAKKAGIPVEVISHG